MEKAIYHGSSVIVKNPKFGAGRAFNDFGIGFYCSESIEFAAEWAVSRIKNGAFRGFVTSYRINTDGLRIINLCSSQYNTLHWISILSGFRVFDDVNPLVHRSQEYINKYFSVDFQGSDCIIGYRADNSCFAMAQDFLAGRLSYQSLRSALTSSDANRQFVLKSNRAFERISFAGFTPVSNEDPYISNISRELKLLKAAAQAEEKNHSDAKSKMMTAVVRSREADTALGSGEMLSARHTAAPLYIDGMIEEDIKPYDPRLY